MAATREAQRLTEAHRLAQVRLGSQSALQMVALFRLLDIENIDGSVDPWLRATVPVIRAQRTVSARMAANYIGQFKKLELGFQSAPAPIDLAEAISADRIVSDLTVAGPASLKADLNRGRTTSKALDVARTRVAGAGMTLVLDGGSDTTMHTIAADRQALGYARTTSGNPCSFCAMLAGRGPVYRSEGTANFRPHDHCSCSAEPIYRRDAAWPTGTERYRDAYNEAIREARAAGELNRGTSNDALNAFRRYMARQ